jgi:hypothetical protein
MKHDEETYLLSLLGEEDVVSVAMILSQEEVKCKWAECDATLDESL